MEQVFASCEGCADLLHEVHCIAQTFPLGHRSPPPGDGRYSHERQGSAAIPFLKVCRRRGTLSAILIGLFCCIKQQQAPSCLGQHSCDFVCCIKQHDSEGFCPVSARKTRKIRVCCIIQHCCHFVKGNT